MKQFLTPDFFKVIIIAGVIIFALIFIRSAINDYVQLNGHNYQVRPDSTEYQIQQLIEERGYYKGIITSLQEQLDNRQIAKGKVINNGKQQIQNYQDHSSDEQLAIWNEKFKNFIK